MKAYLTTIGELTTDICKKQLERFGYEVIVLGGIEAWPDKYKRFIETANEDCIRIDADIVPNENIKEIAGEVIHKTKILGEKILMMQFHCYESEGLRIRKDIDHNVAGYFVTARS